MTKNTLIRDYVVNQLNDDIENGYQVNDNWLNNRLNYWDINKKLFDKKVTYNIHYDNIFECNYYTDFKYNY